MNAFATATIIDHSVERLPGTVHLRVVTDRGNAVLSFTPAEARIAGRALSLKSDQVAPDPSSPPVNHITAAARGLPLEKPHGGVS